MAAEQIKNSVSRTIELDGIQHSVTIESGLDEKNENFYRAVFPDGRVIYLVLNNDTDLWENKEDGLTPESEAIGHLISDYYE